jgi:fermentation-respiration switch protein FrsA (DUF1100 family)
LLTRPWVRSVAYFVVGYVGLVAMLLFLENKLVYQPRSADQEWVPPPINEIQDVYLTCADGTRVHAWYCPCPESDEALLYCHGNGGNVSHRGASIVKVRELLKVSVLIIDYPGYGKSEGGPSEQGCYQAADAAHAWLTDEKKFAPKKILLYGASLGGGVITDLASRKDHRALVLIKTFTSLPDVASELYWWLPVPKHALMRNRFDSLSKIASCRRPVFIAHGTRDELIPYAHGERLYQAANEPKRFLPIEGDGHNNALPEEFFPALKDFLQKHPVE